MAHIISGDNVITIKAILTKAGRQKLASGVDAFNITKFAVADDQIDYSYEQLRTELTERPQKYSLLQPVLNGNLMMKNKLYTDLNINAGAKIITSIDVDGITSDITTQILGVSGQLVYTPTTNGASGQLYNFDINIDGEIPFESISYRTSADGSLRSGHAMPQVSFSNAYQIVFSKKAITSTTYFTMRVTGMRTGASATYTFKVIPRTTSSVTTGATV